MTIKISKYRILGLVGQGQFGQVFCGCHRKTGQIFALKNLDRHRFPTHKFLRELRFLLLLQHPNIVTCHSLE
ncbi:MAG: protein kinase, partial [Desertifilum sp. SIO1I2]|nr:protein kinase [Desertifilum sp. SIO1I2]